MDPLIEAINYPKMATYNTYGFKDFYESVYEDARDAFSTKDGYKDLMGQSERWLLHLQWQQRRCERSLRERIL
jgi:hypothetical protein